MPWAMCFRFPAYPPGVNMKSDPLRRDSPKVRIPAARKFFLFRTFVLPGVMFLASGVLVLVLWQEFSTPTALKGVVQSVEVVIRSPGEGWLRDPAAWSAAVEPGEALAVIDPLQPQQLLAELSTLTATHAFEIRSGRELFSLQQLQVDIASLELELQRTRNRIATGEIRLAFLEREFQRLEALHADEITTQARLEAVTSERDQTRMELSGHRELADQLDRVLGLLRAPLDTAADELALRAALQGIREAQIQERQLQLEPQVLHSPVSAVVTQVHAAPGTVVQRGDALLTLAVRHSHHVIAYLPQGNPPPPMPGAMVRVYRNHPGDWVPGEILQAGPAVQRPPERFAGMALGNGSHVLPLRIRLEDDSRFYPGESVFVQLQPSEN